MVWGSWGGVEDERGDCSMLRAGSLAHLGCSLWRSGWGWCEKV